MASESPGAELYDSLGNPLAVQNATAIPASTPALMFAGSDGTNSRYILVDGSGHQIVVGAGTAGTPTGGVITIQGVSGGTVVPVSGTVAVTQSTSPWVTNITQFGSTNVSTGTGASGAGIPRVTVSNDSNILATQSGTWTVQPGNTANTTPWLVTANQGTPNSLANAWPTEDILNASGQYQAISCSTTAVEALGGGTILSNRKLVSILPTNGTVYYGYNNSVTTSNGTPIFTNQLFVISASANLHIWIIASAAVNCRISEAG
jgi:hypothetical protein